MKRHVYLPDRTVSVEDGTVRDLDGYQLGEVRPSRRAWTYRPYGLLLYPFNGTAYPTQAAALAALLADPSCPTPGPNRYDK